MGEEITRRWLHDTWDLDRAQCEQVIATSAELNRNIHITTNTQ